MPAPGSAPLGAALGVTLWLVLGTAIGCGKGEGSRTTDSAREVPSAPVPNVVLRLSAAGDSAARSLADSLSREGWTATPSAPVSPATTWMVDLAVPGDAMLARLIEHTLRKQGLDPALLVAGTRPSNGLAVAAVSVNRGTHGMSARVRWSASGDRRTLLVVEDPRGVESDPLPNGFVVAVEGVAPVQRDSVWDVAPAPDWRRVAYARAYTTAPGESDSVPPSEWHRLAASVGLMESIVRRNAFPTSGMVAAYGAARPFIIDSLAEGNGDRSRDRALPIAEGWRLGWSSDGSRLAIGAPPELISDDGPARAWRLVDPATGASRGVTDAASVTRPRWTEGPTLDISTPIDMKQRRAFRTGDADVESEDGWIRVYARTSARLRSPRIVGPGVALTTSASGDFIVALASDPDAKSYESTNRLIVYHIVRR